MSGLESWTHTFLFVSRCVCLFVWGCLRVSASKVCVCLCLFPLQSYVMFETRRNMWRWLSSPASRICFTMVGVGVGGYGLFSGLALFRDEREKKGIELLKKARNFELQQFDRLLRTYHVPMYKINSQFSVDKNGESLSSGKSLRCRESIRRCLTYAAACAFSNEPCQYHDVLEDSVGSVSGFDSNLMLEDTNQYVQALSETLQLYSEYMHTLKDRYGKERFVYHIPRDILAEAADDFVRWSGSGILLFLYGSSKYPRNNTKENTFRAYLKHDFNPQRLRVCDQSDPSSSEQACLDKYRENSLLHVVRQFYAALNFGMIAQHQNRADVFPLFIHFYEFSSLMGNCIDVLKTNEEKSQDTDCIQRNVPQNLVEKIRGDLPSLDSDDYRFRQGQLSKIQDQAKHLLESAEYFSEKMKVSKETMRDLKKVFGIE